MNSFDLNEINIFEKEKKSIDYSEMELFTMEKK